MTVAHPDQEHGHDHDRLIEIVVNNHPVPVPEDTTGAEIRRLAGLPVDINLFRIQGDREFPIADDEKIHVHKGQRFLACPGLEPA